MSTVLVTAGPTREGIDPVRFISNHSTGTFGYAIAKEAARRGHKVILISGPVSLKIPSGVKMIPVESAADMRREVKKFSAKADFIIMAAAVSDWRVRAPSGRKIKRSRGRRTLELVENPDILAELGRHKRGVLVGFALETEALEKNAALKLKKKNLDMIVANRLGPAPGVFGPGPTDVLIMDRLGLKKRYLRKPKRELANIILDRVEDFI